MAVGEREGFLARAIEEESRRFLLSNKSDKRMQHLRVTHSPNRVVMTGNVLPKSLPLAAEVCKKQEHGMVFYAKEDKD